MFIFFVRLPTTLTGTKFLFPLTTQDSSQDTETVVVSFSLLQRRMGKWKPHGESSRKMWKQLCAKREKGSSAEFVKIIKSFFASGFSGYIDRVRLKPANKPQSR